MWHSGATCVFVTSSTPCDTWHPMAGTVFSSPSAVRHCSEYKLLWLVVSVRPRQSGDVCPDPLMGHRERNDERLVQRQEYAGRPAMRQRRTIYPPRCRIHYRGRRCGYRHGSTCGVVVERWVTPGPGNAKKLAHALPHSPRQLTPLFPDHIRGLAPPFRRNLLDT